MSHLIQTVETENLRFVLEVVNGVSNGGNIREHHFCPSHYLLYQWQKFGGAAKAVPRPQERRLCGFAEPASLFPAKQRLR